MRGVGVIWKIVPTLPFHVTLPLGASFDCGGGTLRTRWLPVTVQVDGDLIGFAPSVVLKSGFSG